MTGTYSRQRLASYAAVPLGVSSCFSVLATSRFPCGPTPAHQRMCYNTSFVCVVHTAVVDTQWSKWRLCVNLISHFVREFEHVLLDIQVLQPLAPLKLLAVLLVFRKNLFG